MDFRRIDLTTTGMRSLAWNGESLVDWIGGQRIFLDGRTERLNVLSTFRFDAAVGMDEYAVTFEALGTKGRIVRDNGQRAQGNHIPASIDEFREIDRSYYFANAYIFPVALFRLSTGAPAIAHCPRGYNIVDFETLEGSCLTPRTKENAADIFHSRLEISADGRWLLSNGWVWHPWRTVSIYSIDRALSEPAYLSSQGETLTLGTTWQEEVDGATFVGSRVVCATNENRHAVTVFNLAEMMHEDVIELNAPPGTRLMGLGKDYVVLFDDRPRVISLSSGTVVMEWPDLTTGKGPYQPGEDIDVQTPPWIAPDPLHNRFALGWPEKIAVISFHDTALRR